MEVLLKIHEKTTDKLGKTAFGEEKSKMVTGCGFQKNNDLNVKEF